jgi:hypothetical protein
MEVLDTWRAPLRAFLFTFLWSIQAESKQTNKKIANCLCLKHTQDVPPSSHFFLLLKANVEFHNNHVHVCAHAHVPLIWWDQKWYRFCTNSATHFSSLFGYPGEYRTSIIIKPYQHRFKLPTALMNIIMLEQVFSYWKDGNGEQT